MKYSERKISQSILPLTLLNLVKKFVPYIFMIYIANPVKIKQIRDFDFKTKTSFKKHVFGQKNSLEQFADGAVVAELT